jgi:hypothetical protein
MKCLPVIAVIPKLTFRNINTDAKYSNIWCARASNAREIRLDRVECVTLRQLADVGQSPGISGAIYCSPI